MQYPKNNNGNYFLEKGLDKFKDQSYFQYLGNKELSKPLFPLGEFTKS